MSKWELVRLGDVNQYQSASINPIANKEQTYELYSVPTYDSNFPEIITGSEIGSTKQVVQKNDVLLCKINPRINRVWIVSQFTDYPLIASSEWIVFRNDDIAPRYLLWFFKSNNFRKLLCSQVTGIGGSLTRVQPKQVAQYKMPLPQLEIQQKIAAVLDKVSELLALQKRQLTELDNLVKSRFIEMFGDPASNPMGWTIVSIESICNKVTDGEHITPKRTTEGILLLSARNILNHRIDVSDVDFIGEDEYERISKRIVPTINDVLISCSGSVGRVARISDNTRYQLVRSVAILQLKDVVDSVFIEYCFDTDYLQGQINRSVNQSSQANLFQGKIRELKTYLPPLALQNRFADFVRRTDKAKSAIQKSLGETQLLFDSLMSRYFD
jgi:type I restriction enzyme S subunit